MVRPKVGKPLPRPRLPKVSWRRFAGPTFFVSALFYLGFHALNGERGVYGLFKEQRKLEVLQAELKDVQGRRESLERKVKLLGSGSLDLDLLDEQVRNMLGMAATNEVVYFKGAAQN
jgi:cell division protein FtsB